jgi:hypothetical protein
LRILSSGVSSDHTPRVPACAHRQRSERIYTGIGSRETPEGVLESMTVAAARLAQAGWTMRTGLSPGADQAFYDGALAGRGRVELYLPCADFESQARSQQEGPDIRLLAEPTEAAYPLAAGFHPGWPALSPRARRLRARDVHEVLGRDLCAPAALVVCWTPEGSLDGSEPQAGGTGQALRVAHHHGVRVLNLSRPEHLQALSRLP